MSSDKYLTSEPVRYDPAIDPNNMSQYAPKDYRVVSVYQKVCNTPEQETMLPKYIEAINDIESTDPAPPYEQLQLDTSVGKGGGYDDHDAQTAERRRKNKKFAKFALHFFAFMLILFFIQTTFAPLGCGGGSDDGDTGKDNDAMTMSYNDMDGMMGSNGAAESMMHGN